MKYVFQFLLILLISFVSEILHALIPLPVPASIYGLVILFTLLCTKLVKLEHVEGAGEFLLKIMPMLFIPAGGGVAVAAELIYANLWVVLIAMTLSTAFVMIVTGLIAQAMTKRKKAVAASPQSSGEGESGLSPAETPCLNALSASEEKACDEKNAVSGAKEDGDAEISQ